MNKYKTNSQLFSLQNSILKSLVENLPLEDNLSLKSRNSKEMSIFHSSNIAKVLIRIKMIRYFNPL